MEQNLPPVNDPALSMLMQQVRQSLITQVKYSEDISDAIVNTVLKTVTHAVVEGPKTTREYYLECNQHLREELTEKKHLIQELEKKLEILEGTSQVEKVVQHSNGIQKLELLEDKVRALNGLLVGQSDESNSGDDGTICLDEVDSSSRNLIKTLTFEEEAIEKCKTVEDILEILKAGTHLWKVRSFNKWYRRKYYLDDKNLKLCYDPSHKAPCYTVKTEIEIGDILEVRKGWKTDTFNKIGSKVERKMNKQPGRAPVVEEKACFSIIHGTTKESLDLVAPNEAVCESWVRGLKHLVTVVKGLEQERNYDRWLKKQFQEADVDKNKSLNFEECLKLLKQLNVSMSKRIARDFFERANTNKKERDGEQVLDEDEFVKFFFDLMERPEVKNLFDKYAQNSKEMSSTELCHFLQKEQNMPTITTDECQSLIEAFEQSEMKEDGKMSLFGFTHMLLSENFEIFNPEHRVVYQDMSQPLAHYYIASSHNTYLIGNQLSGESSVEGYIHALKNGCRCVELDCWDGPDGDPIIYHGFTLTSKILFKDVIADAIKPYAFHSSEYPVILSLENHCSEEQQEKMAKHLKSILGDMLYLDETGENMKQLPSPENLKHKIIIKAKKVKPPVKSNEVEEAEESDTDDDRDVQYADADEQNAEEERKKKKIVAVGLSNLVNICQAVHFYNFQKAKTDGKCFQMSSFSEAKATSLIEENAVAFIDYNKRQLSRIYPAGKRTDSSNYTPTPFWNVGCQIVALNYQSNWKPVFFNTAKFKQNGNCGYLLKPEVLREDVRYDPNIELDNRFQKVLKLKIISGQHIPKPEQATEGEIVDPYVKVKIIGHPKDKQKWKTESVRNNGFNPRWGQEIVLAVKVPELALVQFTVKDFSITGKNVTLGTYALPFTSMQEGYRHIYLMDYNRQLLTPASLFVHVAISE